MKVMTCKELTDVSGGGWTVLKFLGLGIAAGLTFIGSVIYGYFHPEKC